MSQYLSLNLSLKKCLHYLAQEPLGSFCLHFKALWTHVYIDIPGFFLNGSWKFKLGSWCLHYDPSAHGLRVYPPELRRRCDKHTRWFASLHLSNETECWCSDQRKKQIWTKWSLCECNFYTCRIVSSWMTSVKITYFLSEFPLACLKLDYILCFCSRLFLSVRLFFFQKYVILSCYSFVLSIKVRLCWKRKKKT